MSIYNTLNRQEQQRMTPSQKTTTHGRLLILQCLKVTTETTRKNNSSEYHKNKNTLDSGKKEITQLREKKNSYFGQNNCLCCNSTDNDIWRQYFLATNNFPCFGKNFKFIKS